MEINFIFLLMSLIIYIISYIYSLNFMNNNNFTLLYFPQNQFGHFSFSEIFNIQLFFFAIFIQYHTFYRTNQRIPFYDENHHFAMNNFSKEELILFIKDNHNFLMIFFILSITSWTMLFGSIIHFFFNN